MLNTYNMYIICRKHRGRYNGMNSNGVDNPDDSH